MRKSDMNKMRMYNQVAQIISEHAPVWQANVPFTEVYTSFNAKLDALKTSIDAQFSLKGANSIHKREAKEALINDALRIQQLFTFYAAKVDDQVLLHQVKKTVSYWKRASEINVRAQAEQLRALLEDNLAVVGNYGLAQADLDGFITRIDDFAAAASEPRAAVIQRAHVTENIGELMAQLDALLKLQLDNFVHALTATQADFVNLYDHARDVIRYRGKGHTNPETPQSSADAA